MNKTACKTKARGANIPVPQNAGEAASFLRRLGDAKRARARLETAMNDKIAAIRERYEAEAAPIDIEIGSIAEGLRIFCEANRDRLTDGGKTKTVEFGTGKVSWRLRPAKVVLRKVDDVLAALKSMALHRFIRTKEEVDKEAMLREPEIASTVPGVAIGSEGEEFFIEPFEVNLEGERGD